MGQNIHSMLPKQNFDKSIMSSRCPSIFCPYFWPIAWRAPQRIGGSNLRRMSHVVTCSHQSAGVTRELLQGDTIIRHRFRMLSLRTQRVLLLAAVLWVSAALGR